MILSTFLALALAAKPVFPGSAVTLLGTPSPDGRWISMVEQGDLSLRETATGRSVRLTQAKGKEFAYFSAISRDSRKVAYAWFNEEGYYELRVVPTAGGAPVTLFRNPEAGFVQPCSWTPDGKQILTLFFRKDNVSQIALVPADGGAPKVLRSLNWVYPKRMDISPDGQKVVYDSFAPGSTSQRTIYLLRLDGSEERQLITGPGNHLFPLFAADGKSVYYLSDNDLANVALERGAAPRVVQTGLGRALPLGLTQSGTLYYGIRTGTSDVFLAEIGDIAKTARRVSVQFPGRNLAPAFSPDGKRLAYLSRRGTENFGQESRAVVVRDLGGDAEAELPVRMAHIERVGWRHDGKALLLSGSDGRGRGGVFAYEFATKRTVPLAAEIGGPYRGCPAVATAAGVFHQDGNRVVGPGGETIYTGRNVKGLAALADGTLVVYDENTLVWVGTEKRVVMEGLEELVGGAAPLFAVKGKNLLRVGAAGAFVLPGNVQPGIAVSRTARRWR